MPKFIVTGQSRCSKGWLDFDMLVDTGDKPYPCRDLVEATERINLDKQKITLFSLKIHNIIPLTDEQAVEWTAERMIGDK